MTLNPLLAMLTKTFPRVFQVENDNTLLVIDRDFVLNQNTLMAVEHAHPTPTCRNCGENPVKHWGQECANCLALEVAGQRGRPKGSRNRNGKHQHELVLHTVATAEQGGWTFTAHALDRLSQRGLRAAAVLNAAENPQTVSPSENNPEAKVHEADGVKAVVVEDRRIIITAAHTDRAKDRQPDQAAVVEMV